MSFTFDPGTICAPHTAWAGNYSGYTSGYIYVAAVGSGTTWTTSTPWAMTSGPAGCSLIGHNRVSDTYVILQLTVGSALGTIVLTDGATSTNLPIGSPAFTVTSPGSLPLNDTTYVYLFGTNSVWSSESGGSGRRNFTIAGVADCTLSDPAFSDGTSTDPFWSDRAARLEITTGSSSGILTITDEPTGATATIVVGTATDAGVTTAEIAQQTTFYATLQRQADFFTLNDPVRGELGSVYTLKADSAYDITNSGAAVSVRRGRTSRLSEDIPPGQAVISLRNYSREWDPANASSEWYGNILPGKRINLAVGYTSYFDGFVEDWNFTESAETAQSTATIYAIDALSSLGRRQLAAWTTTASQSPKERIDAVLDRAEVTYGAARDIDDGVITLGADVVTVGTNVLGYLQLIARSDFGYLYVDRRGVLRYRDRLGLANPSVLTLDGTNSGSTFKFHELELQYGSETLYNRVSVTRVGGTLQKVEDTDSINAYGARDLSLTGLLFDDDTAALGLANYLLNLYKQPRLRVASVTIHLHALASDYEVQAIVSLDIGDSLQINTLIGGVSNSIAGVIEGVAHQASPRFHSVTFYLSELDADTRFLVLNDTTLGVLNSARLSF